MQKQTINRKEMLYDNNPTLYVKKLVKIVYEKEKQIEQLKKVLRHNGENLSPKSPLDQQLKHDIHFTTTQIRAATLQMSSMETKIQDLQAGLDEEAYRTIQAEKEVLLLKAKIDLFDREKCQMEEKGTFLEQECSALKRKVRLVQQKLTSCQNANQRLEVTIENQKEQIEVLNGKQEDLSSMLKQYEGFAYQISNCIEAAYLKHSPLRPSCKKIMTMSNLDQERKFDGIINKFVVLERRLEDMRDRMEKMQEGDEIVNETVDGISIIGLSLQEKLMKCQTQNELIDQELRESLEKQEDLLIQQMENSLLMSEQEHADEVEEVEEKLRMTKEVNQQLFDQVNQKQLLLKQCRKSFEKLFENYKGNNREQVTRLRALLQIAP